MRYFVTINTLNDGRSAARGGTTTDKDTTKFSPGKREYIPIIWSWEKGKAVRLAGRKLPQDTRRARLRN